MVKKTLSLLLASLMATGQAWAVSGGPFDAFLLAKSLSYSDMAGTYGMTLTGTNTDHLSSTGVMMMSVSARGLTVGKMLIFDQGIVYVGSATGVMRSATTTPGKDLRDFFKAGLVRGQGSGSLVCQLAHYSVRTTSDGISSTSASFLDGMMNGAVSVQLNPDPRLGGVYVSGEGSLWEYNTRLINVVNSTSTQSSDVVNGTNTNTTSTSTTVVGADPSGVTDAGNSDLVSTNGSPAVNLRSTDTASAVLTFSLDGEMQSTTTTAIQMFTQPNAATNWGVGFGNGDTGNTPVANGAVGP